MSAAIAAISSTIQFSPLPTEPGRLPVTQFQTERINAKTSAPNTAGTRLLISTTRFNTYAVLMQFLGVHHQLSQEVIT